MLPRAQILARIALFVGGSLGCGAHGASGSKLPDWYLASADAYPRTEYAVGRAACGPEVVPEERLACAAERATEEALLQVRAHVAAYRERTCRLDATQKRAEDQTSSTAQSVCSSLLNGHSEASLDVNNAAPRAQSCDTSHCYALVALSRAELCNDLALRTAAQRSSFDQLLARAPDVDLLSGLSLLGEAEDLAPALDETGALTAALRGTTQGQDSYAERLAHARRARLQGASACLRTNPGGNPAAERVFAFASALLSEQGVDKVQLDAVCQSGSLLIDYTSSTEGAPVVEPSASASGLWTVQYAGLVRVSTADGAMARERAVQGRGVARSVESARRDAEERLAGAVRDAIAELILGHAA